MTQSNYWTRRRISRRAALRGAGVGAAGLAGAALIGCGGGDDDEDETTATAAPTTAATTAATTEATATPTEEPMPMGPVQGGVMRYAITGDPPTLDPYGNLSYLTKGFADHVYSRLYNLDIQPGLPGAANLPGPDLAESAEVSEDGMEWVIKLRQGVKFHDIAPVNGREFTSEDVLYSWSRMTAPETENRGQVSVVENLEAVDDYTVKFTLNEVSAIFLDILSDTNLLWIMPKEADGGYDAQTTAIGTGPWILDNYTPDVSQIYKRNPTWHLGPDRPYLDEIQRLVIPEYANQLAQLQAGNLEWNGIVSDDVLLLKNDASFAHWGWMTGDPGSTLNFLFFSNINDTTKPWSDERVRQAISMSLDRAAKLDFEYNVSAFKEAGLSPSEAWHNLIPVGQARYWLDPNSDAMGEYAKFFEYNVAEAKKLMDAAGFGDGFNTKYIYNTNRYGGRFGDVQEVNLAYLSEIGIQGEVEIQDYSAEYITQTFAGEFEGMAAAWETPFPEAGSYPNRMFNVDDALNHSRVDDPEIWDLTQQSNREIDFEARRELLFEIQRLNAKHMYYVPMTYGGGTAFSAYQPWLHNREEYRTRGYGANSEVYTHYWIDPDVLAEYS